MKKSFLVFILLSLITFLVFYLRIINTSVFKFYPDAYQNLIVAKNIQDYGSVVGTLGEKGMIYPPYFMWSRPVYALMIAWMDDAIDEKVNPDSDELIFSAHVISFLMGVFTIPLAYFVFKGIFESRKAGLLTAFLLAISFNHTVWGGYIYTETTGIFFLFLTLLILFLVSEKKSQILDLRDFLLGGSFTLAIFSRYEYILLAIPISYLLIKKSPNFKIKLFNFFLSTTIFSSLFFISLYPIQDTISIILTQHQRLIMIGLGMLIVLIFLPVIYKRYLQRRVSTEKIYRFLPKLLFALFTLLTIVAFFEEQFPFFYHVRGLVNFYHTDMMLVMIAFLGIFYMYKAPNRIILANFVVLSFLVLVPIYYQINPEMQRYWTHLVPFFLIAAGYGFYTLVLNLKAKVKWFIKLLMILLVFIFPLFQIYLTAWGIKPWHGASWTRESYEEKAAKIISSKIDPHTDPIIIASLPEPYYIFTGKVTHSINDNPPYLYINESLDGKDAYVISDMGMVDIFPNFAKFIDANINQYKVDEFWVNEDYHYSIRTEKEKRPVKVYRIKLSELKSIIKEK